MSSLTYRYYMKYVFFVFFSLLSNFLFSNSSAVEKINYYESKHLNTDLFLIGENQNFSIEEMEFFLKTFEITEHPNFRIIRNILIGNIYNKYQHHDTALTFLKKAELLSLQYPNSKKIQRLHIITLINIAEISSNLKKNSFSEENMQKAISLAEENEFEDLLAKANLCYVRLFLEKSPQLVNIYLDKAAKFFIEKDMEYEILEIYLLRSKLLYLYGELNLAEENLNKAFEINNKDSFLSKLYLCKANLNNDNNETLLAIEAYQKAIELSKKYLNYQITLEASLKLFQLFEKLNLHKQAFNTYTLYKEAKDSLSKINSQNKLFLSKIQYQLINKENTVTELKLIEIENEQKIEEHKNNRQMLNMISVFFVLLLILALYFFVLSRNYNKRLKGTNTELQQSNLELRKARSNLEELGRNKDRFFSIIAHDLRSPFNSVLGLSEYISESMSEIEKEEILELNKMIFTSSKSLYNLLENLLDWSKTQIGKLKFEPENIDLYEVLEKELDVLKIIAANKEIQIVSEIKKETMAYFDEGMIATVIRNIINNAIKFTDNKGVIKILSKPNEAYLVVSIIDNGIGISEKNIKKLFNANKQFTTFGTSGEKGTGLGLAICKEFVVMNGGDIKVKSEEAKGTEFEFTLPIRKII